jgi:hypothetical protein
MSVLNFSSVGQAFSRYHARSCGWDGATSIATRMNPPTRATRPTINLSIALSAFGPDPICRLPRLDCEAFRARCHTRCADSRGWLSSDCEHPKRRRSGSRLRSRRLSVTARFEQSFGDSFSLCSAKDTHKADRRQALTFATTIRNGVTGWLCPPLLGEYRHSKKLAHNGAIGWGHADLSRRDHKPSHYDKDGYVIQWWKAWIPSNSMASLYAISQDCAARKVLGEDVAAGARGLERARLA